MDLISDQFTIVRNLKDKYLIRRNGATSPHSGYIFKDSGVMFLYSSGTTFEAEKAYTPFTVYAHLRHQDNLSSAASDLYQQGYGDRVKVEPSFDDEEIKAIESYEADFPIEIGSGSSLVGRISKLSPTTIERSKAVDFKSPEAKKLVKISKKNKRFLFVDYPFIYSESVAYIKKIISSSKLGKPLIYESIREKAPYRNDANVIWDLGIHDFAILQYLLNTTPNKFQSNEIKTKPKFKADFANINLKYKNKFTAFLKLNWSSPTKIRLIKIYFDKFLATSNSPTPSIFAAIIGTPVHSLFECLNL